MTSKLQIESVFLIGKQFIHDVRKLKKVSCVPIGAVSLSFTTRFLKALAVLAPSCSKPQIFKSF